MEWLVFSKNRPYQLDGFIKTAVENGKVKPEEITVLYKYEDEYKDSLAQVKNENRGVHFVEETSFKCDLIDVISGFKTRELSFATDDALFTREVNRNIVTNSLLVENVLCFSCRLGFNVNYCYPVARHQKVPDGQILLETFFFQWEKGECDWSYPLSVDGHFFNRNDMIKFLKDISFTSPNTLESTMMSKKNFFDHKSLMVSDIFSSYFNVPVNVVQDQFRNRHGSITARELHEKYKAGGRFDANRVKNFLNQSPHQEVSL